jgi:hypothetical protein
MSRIKAAPVLSYPFKPDSIIIRLDQRNKRNRLMRWDPSQHNSKIESFENMKRTVGISNYLSSQIHILFPHQLEGKMVNTGMKCTSK